jgi:hypothetical protein
MLRFFQSGSKFLKSSSRFGLGSTPICSFSQLKPDEIKNHQETKPPMPKQALPSGGDEMNPEEIEEHRKKAGRALWITLSLRNKTLLTDFRFLDFWNIAFVDRFISFSEKQETN